MTIRRNVNIAEMNADYSAFTDALSRLPRGAFTFARNLLNSVTSSIDALEEHSASYGVKTDRCDMIREVEVLTFDMLRRTNESVEVEQVIQIGRVLDTVSAQAGERLIENLIENYKAFVLRRSVASVAELEALAS